jgi:hypothetical protein
MFVPVQQVTEENIFFQYVGYVLTWLPLEMHRIGGVL